MKHIYLTALLSVATSVAQADQFADPTWPCIQRKVESLSLGIMWPVPLAEGIELDDAARDLADKLALRRITMDEAEALIEDYAAQTPNPETYGAIFERAFTKMDRDRTRLIRGIERYALSQIDLSEKIETTRTEMNDIMATANPDFDRVDALEETLDWNERIFKDRASSLTYVCESPVLLEKRIYGVAQLLLKHAQ